MLLNLIRREASLSEPVGIPVLGFGLLSFHHFPFAESSSSSSLIKQLRGSWLPVSTLGCLASVSVLLRLLAPHSALPCSGLWPCSQDSGCALSLPPAGFKAIRFPKGSSSQTAAPELHAARWQGTCRAKALPTSLLQDCQLRHRQGWSYSCVTYPGAHSP